MNVPKKRGRPRGFDEGEVLDHAMRVFWRQGYAETSVGELVAATGLERASLYAAFGDKQGLYLATLDRYSERIGETLRSVHKQPGTTAELIEAIYRATITQFAKDGGRGCLISGTAATAAPGMPSVRDFVAVTVRETRAAFTELFVRRGFDRSVDRAGLADAVIHSASLRLRAGEPAEEVLAFALNSIPLLLAQTQSPGADAGA